MGRNSLWARLLKDRGAAASLAILSLFVLGGIFSKAIAPDDPSQMSRNLLAPPSLDHPFGTDELGRDLLSRVIYGARTSLTIAVFSVALGTAIGLFFGLIAAYYGQLTDSVVMRIMDAFMAFPGLILALVLASILGPGVKSAVIAISCFSIPSVSRLLRASVLEVKERPFVEASRAAGAGDRYLMFRVILPNCSSPILVHIAFASAGAILVEAGLAFLGLGVQPPTPSWGSLLDYGRRYSSQAYWYVVAPGGVLFIVVMALNILGDSLRDLLDPQTR
jgi:peptide/nickel transport system permease protein